jgi:uncharacterized membrane protein YtjA (UPF0391 family)
MWRVNRKADRRRIQAAYVASIVAGAREGFAGRSRRRVRDDFHERIATMLRWALAFFVLALIAGVLGFGGLGGDLAYIAKVLVFVFLVLFVVSLIFGRSGPPAV